MKTSNILLLLTTLFLAMSCGKPTAESEMRRWEANQKTIDGLGAQYNGFKTALDLQLQQAQGLWDIALNIEGEEAKAEAMHGSNRSLYAGWVRKLDRMQDRLERLKDGVSESRQTAGATETDIAALDEAISEAKITLSEVESMLRTATANTIAQAESLVNNADRQIDAATKRMDRAVRNIKDRLEEQQSQREDIEKQKSQ